MTAPDQQPDLGAAQLRLDTAVQQLIQPSVEQLDRDHPELDPDVREVDAEHAQRVAELRGRHAALLRAGRTAQARRVLARIAALERHARARRTDRAEIPSLLEQLQAAVAGTGGTNGAPGAGPYRSPIALGAAQLLADIERTVRWGHLAHGDGPLAETLRGQLRGWAARSGHWRTTAPGYLLDAATRAEGWVEDARSTLNPVRRWTHPGACPNCGATTAAVHDDSGELVRRPAIELDRTTATARCLVCSTRWDRDRLPLLAAVLEDQARERAAHAATDTRG